MLALTELRTSQPHALPMLTAALSRGRMHHAYLFTSRDPGSARNVMLRIAASLVCTRRTDIDACGECAACRKLEGGNHPDIVQISPNEKDVIPIDVVRDITSRLSLKATESEKKIVIIERAERMNPAAQNALLKTLEEPPGPTCFLIATSRVRGLAITIRSRCQRVRLAGRADAATAQALVEALPELDANFAQVMAALTSGDVEAAKAHIENGAAEIHERTRDAVGVGALRRVLAAAADLGSERDRADLALAFLEVLVRDGLAHAHGATDAQLLGVPLRVATAKLARAAQSLTELRRVANLHVNRTLALESVLMTLAATKAA